ncbi:protein SRC2-like [Oryza brachyantha]|uniref:protein SRC2-like n=1 Tax=Oryza brachyantha TaxID=4533 RepID=UPI001ADBD07F|nr:protein SRC2-like [Oryza brachyantha]
MACRVLEVTLVSAKDLKKVTVFSKMRVYAVASISGGDPRVPTHRTQADREGGRSPRWHAQLRFPIPGAGHDDGGAADARALALHVLLRAERTFGDSDVGEVFVPVQDLVAAAPDNGEHRHLSYQVRRPVSGRKCGVLHISFQITDDVPVPADQAPTAGGGAFPRYVHGASTRHVGAKSVHAVTAYPATGRGGGGSGGAAYSPSPAYHHGAMQYDSPYRRGHHHHHHHYGYGAVGPSYGYSPAPYGHGAPAAASHGGGMGVGAGFGVGLLGGAVGGMVLGDMLADAEMDAPFDPGMGF